MSNIVTGTSLLVQYAHTIDYFSKGIDSQGPFYRVKYLIANWSDSDPFINALRGVVQSSGGTSGAISRLTPHQHPLSPNLYCVSAVCEGYGAPVTNANGYPSFASGALITAEYRPMVPYGYQLTPNEELQQIDPATPILWCTQELDFSTEYVTIQNSQVTYQSGTYNGQKVPGSSFRIRIPLCHMVLTFHKLPYMPASVVRAQSGLVNGSTFLGAAQGYVYFPGARVTREANSDGTVVQKLQMTFIQRTISGQKWNNLPGPDLVWVNVAGPGGVNLYTESGNFSQLINF